MGELVTIVNERKGLIAGVARLFAAVFVLSAALTASGACTAPRYRVGRILEDTPSDVSLHISIPLTDFAPERLVCLAGTLKNKYVGRNVFAVIFSAHDAAQRYSPAQEKTAQTIYMDSKLHAVYSYNENKHDDRVLIMPSGLTQTDSPFNTRIDLPVTGTPVCRLAMSGRCLLEFGHVDFPYIEGKTEASGQVTFAGSIQRNGAVTGLAVVDAKADPPERRSLLVDSAKQNLGTWRFEPGKTKENVRITYYYEITDSPLASNDPRVQIRLPDEVRVETGRSR